MPVSDIQTTEKSADGGLCYIVLGNGTDLVPMEDVTTISK
jgi:hypothetical protein